MTLMALRRSLDQRSRSASDGHRSFVNSVASEPLKEFEPKLNTNIYYSRAANRLGLKVRGSCTISYENAFSHGGGTPIDSSLSTCI